MNTSSIGDRLRELRRSNFFGRTEALALFEDALAEKTWPFFVLHLSGAGGIGKSALVGRFEQLATDRGLPFLRLDGRFVAPNPSAFREAWNELSAALPEPCLKGEARWVLAIDTWERLGPIEAWMREVMLPTFPEGGLVILSGRARPRAEWLADPTWRSLTRALELEPLDFESTSALLAAQGIDSARFEPVFRMTSGHPLATHLVASQIAADANWDPSFGSASTDIIANLVDRFLDEAPSPVHREALEIASIALFTHQDLLADLLPQADAFALTRWLSGLAFIQSESRGLMPHDLAREAIFRDLQRRSPHHFRHLRIRVHDALAHRARFDRPDAAAMRELVYLQRADPVMSTFFNVVASGSHWIEPGTPEDHASVLGATRRFEGAEAAHLLHRWLEKRPEALWVSRSFNRPVTGFAFAIHHEGPVSELAHLVPEDPATAAFIRATRDLPVRPGESAFFIRNWMDLETHQRITPVQTALFFHLVQRYLTLPRLMLSAMTYADPAFWRGPNAWASMPLLEGATFQFSPHPEDPEGFRHPTCGMYHRDWRSSPPLAWLALMGRRDGPQMLDAPPEDPTASARLLLARDGSWFSAPDGERVDLTSRRILRALLMSLVAARNSTPPRPLSLAELQEVGWPGEKTSFHSGRQRVYVAISTLRKLGLETLLVSSEQGYAIEAPIAFADA